MIARFQHLHPVILALAGSFLICLNGVAEEERVFESKDFDDGASSVIRELYPKSKVVFTYFERRSGIFISVHELTEGSEFLFVVSESESKLEVLKNGKPIKPEEVFKPRKVKVFGQKYNLEGESVVNKDHVGEQRLGYLLRVEEDDQIKLGGEYDTDDNKVLQAEYNRKDGWRINIHPAPTRKIEPAQQGGAGQAPTAPESK